MPDGAESHVLKGWLFDRLTRHVALGEALIDIELSHQNSVALLTYGYGKGFNNNRFGDCRVDFALLDHNPWGLWRGWRPLRGWRPVAVRRMRDAAERVGN